MEWTQSFEKPTPDLGAQHSSRGKDILARKFKGAPEAKVNLCAEVVRALGGKIEEVETMVKKLESIPELPFFMNARTSRGRIKDSAVIKSDGADVRLDWLIKHESNLLKTKQFEEVQQEEKETRKKLIRAKFRKVMDNAILAEQKKSEKTKAKSKPRKTIRKATRKRTNRKTKESSDELLL